jgi:ProP effector
MNKMEHRPRTDSTHRAEKARSMDARLKALRWLANTFPEAFDSDQRIRPLEIGIMQKIIAYRKEKGDESVSLTKLREAVVMFTRRIDYLTCLKAREQRIDLYGKPIAEVTQEEADKAAQKIKKRIEKNIRTGRKIANQSSTSRSAHPFNRYQGNERGERAERGNERYPQYQNTQPVMTMRQAPNVTVRQKTRQYDPNAVERLKEKLRIRKEKETT